jgi:hypothetical protein
MRMKRQTINFSIAAFLLAGLTICLVLVFHKSSAHSADTRCLACLREIYTAKRDWALDHHKSAQDTPTWADLQPYIHIWRNPDGTLSCPKGGVYIIGRMDENPRCPVGDYALP